jgi:hypothetical protein
LDLGLGLLGISSCKDVWGRVFSPFNLALKGIETLDILLFQGAGSTAGCAHIEVGRKFPPFFVFVDLSQSTNLLYRHIEAIEVQRFSTHSRQICHAHGLFLCEGQITVHPHLPLRLTTQLIQLGDLLIGCSRRTGFLGFGFCLRCPICLVVHFGGWS